ncbi:hypothetical protein [Silvanigrella sp.]|jgi:hypothetical protein|uniref:hypothetical protein n=1 Tax=Silvanigrella sp. TaxID=2024976 RepID=UPI0037C9032A
MNLEKQKSENNFKNKLTDFNKKCLKYSDIINDFKSRKESIDLKELYDTTKYKLNNKISQIEDLINRSSNETEYNNLNLQKKYLIQKITLINLLLDENLMETKKNIDIFSYTEGDMFKNSLIFCLYSLKNNFPD